MNENIIKLNLEDEICPYTLIKALKKSKEIQRDLQSGNKVLEVTVDHPPVIDNFPGEFGKRGYKVEIKKIGKAKWSVLIKK